MRAVDDFLLKDILETCPKLEKVSVFGCNRITVSTRSSFVLFSNHLQSLTDCVGYGAYQDWRASAW